MILFENYSAAFWGIFVSLLTLIFQQFVAAITKGSQEEAIPGKIDESLSHSSFVFRSHRTFMNSIENFPAMLGTSFLAVFVGANATWTALLIWTFTVARIAHMSLYYAISTEKNPSPRSYFFLIGVIANIALLGFCLVALM